MQPNHRPTLFNFLITKIIYSCKKLFFITQFIVFIRCGWWMQDLYGRNPILNVLKLNYQFRKRYVHVDYQNGINLTFYVFTQFIGYDENILTFFSVGFEWHCSTTGVYCRVYNPQPVL